MCVCVCVCVMRRGGDISQNIFRWTKISLSPATIAYIREIFSGIVFWPCGKDHHRLYEIVNMGQEICGIKISPMRAGGEKGKNFLHAKISGYTVVHHVYIHGIAQVFILERISE